MNEKDLIEEIPNWEYTYLYEGSRTCGKSYIQHLLDEKDKEIERLNNIINELEKEISRHIALCSDVTLNDILDKLKELKENK